MEYFELNVPNGSGLCSDNECTCGYPGAKIPIGTGYMFISQGVVDFRKDAHSLHDLEKKIIRIEKEMNISAVFGQNTVTSIMMCKQGAMKRGLDLEVALADAEKWWYTGLVPLRATPLAGSSEAKKEKKRLLKEKTIVVEAKSINEARDKLLIQKPEKFQVLSEHIISDGKPQTIKIFGTTIKAAFKKAQGKIPKGSEILEKNIISDFKHKSVKIAVKAIDEQSAILIARETAMKQSSNKITTQGAILTLKGNKGFLGIGKRSNQYTVKLIENVLANVEITYRPMAKIFAITGM